MLKWLQVSDRWMEVVYVTHVSASVAVVTTTKKRKNVPSFNPHLHLFRFELGVSLCGTTSRLMDG